MDYGLLPPEINSGRMYSGPGADSLLAAGAAWAGLAAELHGAAAGYRSVISRLTCGPWQGPASLALATAVAPYVAWLVGSAENAELTASQAAAVAAAYDTAFALTVPPPVIAANRAHLAALVATNIFGQNSPAIATTEADYLEMWARDAAAMYGYASSSAAASAAFTDFATPAATTNPAALAGQAAAVADALGDSFQAASQDIVTNLNSQIPGVLKSLAVPSLYGNLKPIDDWLVANTPFDDLASMYAKYVGGYVSSAQVTLQMSQAFGMTTNAMVGLSMAMKGGWAPTATGWGGPAAVAVDGAAHALGQAAGSVATSPAANAGGLVAGLGKALPVGALSVPPSWAPVNAVTNPAMAAFTNAVTDPIGAEGLNTLPMVPLAPLTGGQGRSLPSYGFKPVVMPRPPSAG